MSDRGTGGAKTDGKPTQPHNLEETGIEDEDDDYDGHSIICVCHI